MAGVCKWCEIMLLCCHLATLIGFWSWVVAYGYWVSLCICCEGTNAGPSVGSCWEDACPDHVKVFLDVFAKESQQCPWFWRSFVLRRSAEVFNACGDLCGSKELSCCSGQLWPVVWLLKFSNQVWPASVCQLVVLIPAVMFRSKQASGVFPALCEGGGLLWFSWMSERISVAN